jgi:hypothetical protein
VYLRLLLPQVSTIAAPGRAIEAPLNRGWRPASRGQAVWLGG